MRKETYEIGVIISSLSLVEKIRDIADKRVSNLHIANEGLEEAIHTGKKMQNNGVEVIISRRGTAHILRENLQIPVLSIPQASIGILKSFKKASALSNKIVLTAFMKKIAGIEIMGDLLNIEIVQGVYQDIESIEKAILSAKDRGCKVAVGGGITERMAKRHALESVEFEVDEETIIAAFENAKSVADVNRKEQKKAYLYRCIMDSATEGIIAVDKNGRINAINRTAKTLIGIESKEIQNKPIATYLKNKNVMQVLNSKIPIKNRLEKIGETQFIFNHMPLEMNNRFIGGVSTFKDVSNVMNAENVVRRSFSKGLVSKYGLEDLIYRSAIMRGLIKKASQFAKTDSTILIMGDTGTGKEIMAHGIHRLSARSKNPFVPVHCGAFPEQLLESELFGYAEGAFTGSKKGGNPGRFEISHKGTIFLDEINTTPLNVQIRLLRVLEEKEVMRIGADRKLPIDVRVIAASSNDLSASVQERKFREELFFRLSVLRIKIPSLKDRPEDIPALFDYFMRKFSLKYRFDPIALPHSYMQKLTDYAWPGNVRQLRNYVERFILNSKLGNTSDDLDELYTELVQYSPDYLNVQSILNLEPLNRQIKAQNKSYELIMIKKALENAKYCKTKTAKDLGISRTTLWRKLKYLKLE